MEMVGRKPVGVGEACVSGSPPWRQVPGWVFTFFNRVFSPISLEVIQKTLIFVGVNRFCRTPWKA